MLESDSHRESSNSWSQAHGRPMTSISGRGETMDPDNKPFKTIEVIDANTNQKCKVACMSCIRGHRTTSCGIPVCRTKIFWTVKRPGRPSNSCTCRFGAAEGCKCVTARTACGHRTKKGEKRSPDCRCDEQGRFCCVLETEHWAALIALNHPSVDFFRSLDELQSRQKMSVSAQLPRTPSFSVVTHNTPNFPLTTLAMNGLSPQMLSGHVSPVTVSTPYNAYQYTKPPQISRFGMMGIGAPQGSSDIRPTDVLAWQGSLIRDPQDLSPTQVSGFASPEESTCCQSSAPTSPGVQPHQYYMSDPFLDQSRPHPQGAVARLYNDPVPLSPRGMTQVPPFSFWPPQFPSSICQSCCLANCTCKNCPPPLQNPHTGSWGQGCGRKHAREIYPQRTPEPINKVPRLRAGQMSVAERANIEYMPAPHFESSAPLDVTDANDPGNMNEDITTPLTYDEFDSISHTDFTPFGIHNSLNLSVEPGQINLADYLVPDPDPLDQQGDMDDSGGGCCCRGSS